MRSKPYYEVVCKAGIHGSSNPKGNADGQKRVHVGRPKSRRDRRAGCPDCAKVSR